MGLLQVTVVGFLLAISWPFGRLAMSPAVGERRRDQLALVAGLCGYMLSVIVIAVRWPQLLWVLATAAAVPAAAFWWRSRSGYGRDRGIPPGRIMVHPLGVFEDVNHLVLQAQRYGPIFKIGATFPVPTATPIICVVGHDLALELLRHHEDSLEVYPPFPISRLIRRGFLRNMTVQDHEVYAPIFRQAFSAAMDSRFEQDVTRAARRVLLRMQADSAVAARGIAPVPYMRDFAFEVLARLHFGYEPASADLSRLVAHFKAIDSEHFSRWLPKWTRRTPWTTAVEHLQREFRAQSPTVVPSVLGQALAFARSIEGGSTALDEDTVVGNALQMQDAGTADLSALLVWVTKLLADHPIWIERLHDEALASTGTASLAERVIRESLRLEQSELLSRRVTRDIRFRGYLLPKGWRLRICIREAHRSANVFDRPTDFDPERFVGPPRPSAEYAPFGLDRHRCLAARLVHKVGATFVDELARGYQLTKVQDGPREHGRFHWRPSPRLRVRLESRDTLR